MTKFVYFCLMWLLQITGNARLMTNVALNRPAFQSSNWTGGTASKHGPQFAVDGNKGTNMDTIGCATTSLQLYPWWAVDLGVQTHVAGVQFTNSDSSSYSGNTKNFIVGVTNDDPRDSPPTPWNYEVCGQWRALINAGGTVYLQCERYPAPGRYLIVQHPLNLGPTPMCELEVYPRRFDWVRSSGLRMGNNRTYFSIQVPQQLSCQVNCTLSSRCDSFNYHVLNNTCELNTHATPLHALASDMFNSTEWEWWSNTFTDLIE